MGEFGSSALINRAWFNFIGTNTNSALAGVLSLGVQVSLPRILLELSIDDVSSERVRRGYRDKEKVPSPLWNIPGSSTFTVRAHGSLCVHKSIR